ncbi:24899_t:CDS:2, partial [Gigaspora margarita]
QEHPMDPTVNINQNISISERESSFQGSMSENLMVEKRKPNTEDLIDLCSEIPINNTIVLNKIEKSFDIMPPHSQIKSHNIHLSTKTQNMIMSQNSEKVVRYLRSDATPLSDNNIQDIINARNSMKRASEAIAIKYKISTRRVYQIWRENHPPIDPREMMSQSNI